MTRGTKAVAVAIAGVVAGLGVGWLILQLASSGRADVRLGDAEFNAGYSEVLAGAIEDGDGQPLIFNDLVGGDRDIYVQHRGSALNEGWSAFETRVPRTEDCFAEWDVDEEVFRSTCDDAVTFPADGEGLTAYPTRLSGDERLIVDLRN